MTADRKRRRRYGRTVHPTDAVPKQIDKVEEGKEVNEDDVRTFLTLAYNRGEISNNGSVLKNRLRTYLLYNRIRKNQFESIDPENVGSILSAHGFLLDTNKNHGIFKINLDKLPDKVERIEATVELTTTDWVRTLKPPNDFESRISTLSKNFNEKYEKYLKSLPVLSQIFEVDFKIDETCMKVNAFLTNKSQKGLMLDHLKIYTAGKPTALRCDFNISADEVFETSMDVNLFKIVQDFYFAIYADGIGMNYVEVYHVTVKHTIKDIVRAKRTEKDTRAELAHISNPLRSRRLKDYWPDQGLMKVFTEDFKIKSNIVDTLSGEEFARYKELVDFKRSGNVLTPDNYTDVLKILVELEDLYINNTLMLFSIASTTIEQTLANQFCISIAEIPDFPEAIEEWDFICLETIHPVTRELGKEILIPICKIANERIYFEPEDSKKLDVARDYRVHFQKDRTCLSMEQEALATTKERIIENILFPDAFGKKVDENSEYSFQWFNRSITENVEQQQAVKRIVEGRSFPAPYIIFGPPGTGKTSTIVETVCQIWKNKPKANILVTAPSNFACDEIASRLIKYIPPMDLYRYYPRSQLRRMKNIDEDLLAISNLASGNYKYASPKVLRKYRIVLTTLINSGRLALNGLPKGHFNYVILDECGSATESTALIPIAGLVSHTKGTNVVLAGDPKQLGPIVQCDFARIVGLGKSLLERLMEADFYKPVDGIYNSHVITKLLQNFRSHAQILKVPNDLFYDGQLIPKASPTITDFALQWSILPNKTVPVIFHCVDGKTEKNANSFSMFNEKEIDEVVMYVQGIVKTGKVPLQEIGVVSPYRLQCQRIKNRLKGRKLNAIEVGSAEQFQGKEKMIIIISTVRSNTSTAGFLGNPKRFNVVVTRAKGLLVVLGNAKTLQLDLNWYKFIEFCKNNNATKGSDFKLVKPKAAQVNAKGKPIKSYEDRVIESMDSLVEQFSKFLIMHDD